jgi:Tol biopolymer transport system component
MSASKRMGLHGCVSVLGIFVLACGDSATAPAPRDTPASRDVSVAVNLTSRIAYTAGAIHIYNLATNADVNLGVSGVNPKFSPDGTLITYQNNGIKVMNADGTGQRLLSPNGGTPSFDPTGTMITFGDQGIWKIHVDGTGLTRLTTDGGIQPAWSPDGTQIAYDASVGSAQQLFIMNADGTNRH